jgi:phospho-N-acetylmuramoyl-pentapeptide-transferase
MILWFMDWLKVGLGVKVPTVFSYTSTRMVLAALTALLFSIFVGPAFIRKLYELKVGQKIRPADFGLISKLHEKKQETPTMGGLLILASMLLSLVLFMDLTHVFTLLLAFTTLTLGLLGGLDDYLKIKFKNSRGLSARKKVLCQLAIASVIAIYLLVPTVSQGLAATSWYHVPAVKEQTTHEGAKIESRELSLKDYASLVYVPFIKDPVIHLKGVFGMLAGFLIVFVIVGSSNAVNLTDGLDGLAAGCLILVASCLALFAFVSNHHDMARYLNILYIEGSGEIAIYLSAFIGACLGFLWYNGHPAQVFMGDIGSLTLGGLIGVSAVLLKRELLLALIGGIFVAETVSVILQVGSYRWRNKKRIFLCTPLHHHFEYLGWPETKVVIRFWIIGLILALIGLASLRFQ